MAHEFNVDRLLRFTERDKYAATVAAFEIIDMVEQIEVPKKMLRAKPAVRSIYVLDNEIVKWGYIAEEERQALREELGLVERAELSEKEGTASSDASEDAKKTKKPNTVT